MKPRLPLDPDPPSMALADALASVSAYLALGILVLNGAIAIAAWIKGAL